jgi:hippurate hydrolase
VERAVAIHISTRYAARTIALRPGPLLASTDAIRATVRGRGGHASAPHFTLDPIPVACEIVQALQIHITRRIDAFDPAVVTVGRIQAGTTNNVIPETAEIIGTIRAVSERTRSRVHDGIRRVAEGIAAAHEMAAEVQLTMGYPVTVNDDDFAAFTAGAARDLLGADHVKQMSAPIMGAEDWSYVLQRVPGSMAFLGAMPPNASRDQVHPNHSNRVVFDEAAMVQGMATYAAVSLRHLTP